MNNISDYDLFSYDYSQYWQKRRYEHLSETHLLNRIFRKKNGNWFLDVGGSYGRLTPTYYNHYQNPIILDYSAKTLRNNYAVLVNKYPGINLIAANAYKMPFKNNTFDGGLMVRVLHHIENPKEYFKELKRVFKNDGKYVQEFANKIHIKARIKAVIKRDREFFNTNPYKQPTLTASEGTKNNIEGIFFNYHPQHIKNLLINEKFLIEKKYGCSYFRSPFFKKIFNDDTLLFFEKIMQRLFSFSNFPPSIFYDTIIKKSEKVKIVGTTLEDILACPKCKGNLKIKDNLARCNKCNLDFKKEHNVWDFRIE